MDVHSGKFYWPTTITKRYDYPSLEQDIICDVLIIGAGSSGAQCAYYLKDKGLNVVMVDKHQPGQGSTAVNTALLQYAGEKMYYQLINSFGEEYATRHLKLCEQAIDEIERSTRKLPISSDFIRRNSLYYASEEEDVSTLKEEYAFLKKNGFDVEFLEEADISERFPFQKRAAILYKNDAELNPLAYTLGMLETLYQSGIRIFANTKITGDYKSEFGYMFTTEQGFSIQAKQVIVACGYEGLEFKQDKNAVLSSSYAVVTKPVDLSFWPGRELIWETARPYYYFRTTADNRIIIGGADETTVIADKRDTKIIYKRELLLKELHKLFPNLKAEAEFFLGATYGGTHDGLPIIGEYSDRPGWHFLLAYGDNGMVYSMVIGKIIAELITSGNHPDLELYRNDRPLLKKV